MINERNKNIKEITFKYNISALIIYNSIKDSFIKSNCNYCNRKK